eukprot:7911817-Pyramimonas_sp.AAC.1
MQVEEETEWERDGGREREREREGGQTSMHVPGGVGSIAAARRRLLQDAPGMYLDHVPSGVRHNPSAIIP